MKTVADRKLIINNGLTIETRNDSSVTISTGKDKFKFDLSIFAILDQFSKPSTIPDALQQLKSGRIGIQDWIQLSETIVGLHKNNILVESDKQCAELNAKPGGYNSASFHIALLNDRSRTKSFIEAIRKTVKKGDIVLDIGTGTGVLAIAAAKYGAKHVYAIEASDIAELAKANIERNGLSERITLIRGYSTQVKLPQQADVLVSEVIGNDPLEEGILEIFTDAFRRHLKQNARCIPESLRIHCLPAAIPPSVIGRHSFSKKQVGKWQSDYGINFNALYKNPRPHEYSFYIHPSKARKWNFLSPPILLADIKLNDPKNITIQNKCICKVTSPGILNGLLVYFNAELAGNIKINTNPMLCSKESSWTCKVWINPKSLKISKGDRFDIEYSYRAPGIGNKFIVKL